MPAEKFSRRDFFLGSLFGAGVSQAARGSYQHIKEFSVADNEFRVAAEMLGLSVEELKQFCVLAQSVEQIVIVAKNGKGGVLQMKDGEMYFMPLSIPSEQGSRELRPDSPM